MRLVSDADVRVSPRVLSRRVALLSLDFETDYGTGRDEALGRVRDLLDRLVAWNIPLTAFVEGQLFARRPALCRDLVDYGVDVQLHVYDHSTPGDTPDTLRLGVEAYRAFMGRPPDGYRAHTYRLTPALLNALMTLGFRWDSSLMRGLGLGRNGSACFRHGDYFVLGDSFYEFPVGTWRTVPLALNHPYSLLAGSAGGRVLRALGPSGPLVVCNVHMTDLWRSPALSQAPYGRLFEWMQRWMWLGHGQDTFAPFRDLCDDLRARGYRFMTTSALHADLSREASTP